MRIKGFLVLASCGVAFSVGCAVDVKQNLGQTPAERTLNVGAVQREIRVGMSGSDVVGVLGAPNIVTTDEVRREVWVYDKISTDSAYSTVESGVHLLKFDAGISTGRTSTTQKTLTVVIKYDEQAKVRDFAYHYSKF